MAAKSLKIKNELMFYPNDMIPLNNFDSKLLLIILIICVLLLIICMVG